MAQSDASLAARPAAVTKAVKLVGETCDTSSLAESAFAQIVVVISEAQVDLEREMTAINRNEATTIMRFIGLLYPIEEHLYRLAIAPRKAVAKLQSVFPPDEIRSGLAVRSCIPSRRLKYPKPQQR